MCSTIGACFQPVERSRECQGGSQGACVRPMSELGSAAFRSIVQKGILGCETELISLSATQYTPVECTGPAWLLGAAPRTCMTPVRTPIHEVQLVVAALGRAARPVEVDVAAHVGRGLVCVWPTHDDQIAIGERDSLAASEARPRSGPSLQCRHAAWLPSAASVRPASLGRITAQHSRPAAHFLSMRWLAEHGDRWLRLSNGCRSVPCADRRAACTRAGHRPTDT